MWKKKRFLVSDVYSLGMTLHFMLFGQPAYNGVSAVVACGQRSPRPVEIPPGCPEDLRRLLAGMLEKNPLKRWSLDQVLTAIRARLERLAVPCLALRVGQSRGERIWHARHRQFSMEFVWIPPGTFLMGMAGATGSDRAEEPCDVRCTPLHRVRVDGFWMSRHPVTRGQFRFFVKDSGYKTGADQAGWAHAYDPDRRGFVRREGSNWLRPGFAQEEDHPVVNVSYADALEFAEWLSWRCHRLVRLPTEAEWERACRAGGQQRYGCGEEITAELANFGGLRVGTTPVGRFPVNRFGLLDMHGNVHEWVRDWFREDFYAVSPERNPYCDQSDSGQRVLRGGGWLSPAERIRSASRDRYPPESADGDIGFRLSGMAYAWEGGRN
ncbi:MAG: SUMF1/EgtB/PvdO family nonheme iron enzyme [Magnetococcales bacterium]|nr:SUMF1/EgtB/PvdO family nonheme iron enzyme [Magnetococcales bacterium]